MRAGKPTARWIRPRSEPNRTNVTATPSRSANHCYITQIRCGTMLKSGCPLRMCHEARSHYLYPFIPCPILSSERLLVDKGVDGALGGTVRLEAPLQPHELPKNSTLLCLSCGMINGRIISISIYDFWKFIINGHNYEVSVSRSCSDHRVVWSVWHYHEPYKQN